jgi:hypothetical protein
MAQRLLTLPVIRKRLEGPASMGATEQECSDYDSNKDGGRSEYDSEGSEMTPITSETIYPAAIPPPSKNECLASPAADTGSSLELARPLLTLPGIQKRLEGPASMGVTEQECSDYDSDKDGGRSKYDSEGSEMTPPSEIPAAIPPMPQVESLPSPAADAARKFLERSSLEKYAVDARPSLTLPGIQKRLEGPASMGVTEQECSDYGSDKDGGRSIYDSEGSEMMPITSETIYPPPKKECLPSPAADAARKFIERHLAMRSYTDIPKLECESKQHHVGAYPNCISPITTGSTAENTPSSIRFSTPGSKYQSMTSYTPKARLFVASDLSEPISSNSSNSSKT